MNPSPVFAILFHRLGRKRTAFPLATKTDHPLQAVKLNALNEVFFRRCAFILMACNLGTYGNSMYDLIYISSF